MLKSSSHLYWWLQIVFNNSAIEVLVKEKTFSTRCIINLKKFTTWNILYQFLYLIGRHNPIEQEVYGLDQGFPDGGMFTSKQNLYQYK